jgi:SAM-dependent methyltransferase
MSERKQHWERTHTEKAPDEVSWFQAEPALSVELIERLCPGRSAAIIDVGGGVSNVVDRLLERGYTNVTVLDIAEAALRHTKERLGPEEAAKVTWLVGDALDTDLGTRDLWHDRAMFHFLVEDEHRQRYVKRLESTVRRGGHAIVTTFADDGPRRCSGLDTMGYNGEELHAELGEGFELLESHRHTHVTPAGKEQRFIVGVFRRV